MLIFWDQRLVFLATPKTGSTAIEAALAAQAAVAVTRPPLLKHTPGYRYRRFIQPYLEKSAGAPFTAVALMREPVDWLASWYRFRRRADLPDAARSTADMSFEQFVEGYVARPQPAYADVGAQSRFLAGRKPGQQIEHLFAYERMEDFVAFMSGRLGCALSLPRVNVSPPADCALGPRTAGRLRHHCAAEFALYDAVLQGHGAAAPRSAQATPEPGP